MIGTTLSHYRIVSELGRGGMGVVYRAHDERLDRDVAIKVLPEEVAQNADRLARFEREAKAVAKLDHPNILAIHDFGTDRGVTYAVTELLDGQDLRQSITASGMPWQKVVEIGAAIAHGLAAAHSKGIVHRDLKPENVFITSDGRVKVLDFGLAQVKEPVEPEAETATMTPAGTAVGTIMGTMGYMSPEQLKGEASDARSDIFAFGCVLYEMLSGDSAFLSKSTAETTVAILKEEPPSLSSSGTIFPSELERAIRRCLEKSPEARFQSASDLAYNLRAVSSGSAPSVAHPAPRAVVWRRVAQWAAIGIVIVVAVVLATVVRGPLSEKGSSAPPGLSPNRVAVVAMENRTGDPSLDALGAMAADLIVQRFTETGAVEVVPLADALQELPSTGPDRDLGRGWASVLQVARQRGASLVLAGAYYLQGDTLRLQARLVDASTGDLIYAFEPVAATRDSPAEGIDSLGERVLAGVAAHVNAPDFDIAVMRPPSTYEAFQAFQRAEELYGKLEEIAQYRRAYELDPDFAFARIMAVWTNININDVNGAGHELSVLEEQLDRLTVYEQVYVRFQRSFLEWGFSDSVIALRRMMELAPQMPWQQLELGWIALWLNRPREAIEALEPMIDVYDPAYGEVAWWHLLNITVAHHMLGDYERELESAELGFKLFPGVADFFYARARALAALGSTEAVDEVINDFLRIQTRGGSAGWLMSATAMELRAHGHRELADEKAVRSVTWYENHPSVISEEGGTINFEMRMLGFSEEKGSFANALWMVGRWRDLEDLIVQLIDTEPNPHRLVGWLGVVAAIRGDKTEAMRISDGLPVGDSPRASAWGSYWQAAIAAHLGEKDRAVELLAEAFSTGFPYGTLFHNSMEFEPLWGYPPFQELIEPKG